MQLVPKHIITTYYDKLIENSNNNRIKSGVKRMENNKLSIKINNICYAIRTTLTLSSILLVSEAEDSNADYRQCVANIILNSIIIVNNEESPSIEEIISADDSIYETYINAVIQGNNDLLKYYMKRPEHEEQCEKFCKAIGNYFLTLSLEISKNIADSMVQVRKPMYELSKFLTEKINSITKPFNYVIANFRKVQDQLLKSIKNATQIWNDIDWDALTDSCKKWGEYGWTIIGNAPLGFYTEFPKSNLEADKKAMQYFNSIGINHLFNDLRKQRIRKKDLGSAFFCFDNRQYKACAMLLCSLIEAPLIKLQPIDINDKRKVGLSAVIKFKNGKATAKSVNDGKLLYRKR